MPPHAPTRDASAAVTPQLRGRWLIPLGVLLGFLLLSILHGTERLLRSPDPSSLAAWQGWLLRISPSWLAWLPLLPLIHALVRRFRLDRSLGPATLCAHLAGLVVVPLVHLCLFNLVVQLQYMFTWDISLSSLLQHPFFVLSPRTVVSILAGNAYYYPIWIFLALAVEYTRDHRRREVEAAHLAERLARAEWQSLRSQLPPAFLNRCLRDIADRMHVDLPAAEQMLELLAELLRRSLRELSLPGIPLHSEVDFVATSLAIERLQRNHPLPVDFQVDGSCATARVPHRLLQPMIEHLLNTFPANRDPGQIHLRAVRRGEMLEILLAADGPMSPTGLGPSALDPLRARLSRTPLGSISVNAVTGPTYGLRLTLPFVPDEMAGLGPDTTWGARGGHREPQASRRSPSFMTEVT